MKKGTFIIGVVSSCLFAAGIIMKLQHWPGAGLVLTISGVLFTAGYATLLLIDKDKLTQNNYQKFVNAMTYLATIVIMLGLIFKVQHWPWANVLVIIGHAFLVTMIPVLFIQGSKETDQVRNLNFNNTAILLVLLTAFSFFLWLKSNING